MGLDQVAFFRNLNLGQGVSPTRTQLLEAFAGAGVDDALSHRSTARSPSTPAVPAPGPWASRWSGC